MYYLEIYNPQEVCRQHQTVSTSYEGYRDITDAMEDAESLLDNFLQDGYFITIRRCDNE